MNKTMIENKSYNIFQNSILYTSVPITNNNGINDDQLKMAMWNDG